MGRDKLFLVDMSTRESTRRLVAGSLQDVGEMLKTVEAADLEVLRVERLVPLRMA
jgi:hypothetical protein